MTAAIGLAIAAAAGFLLVFGEPVSRRIARSKESQ